MPRFDLGPPSALSACLPDGRCGLLNLDDNMGIQKGAFLLTLLCWVVWCTACFTSMGVEYGDGTTSRTLEGGTSIPVVNTDQGLGSQAAVLGTILFNFGFVTTVPSWVNEKQARISWSRTGGSQKA